jgi:hypothetical protein
LTLLLWHDLLTRIGIARSQVQIVPPRLDCCESPPFRDGGFLAWNQTRSTACDWFKFCRALPGFFSAVAVTFFSLWRFQSSNARHQQTQRSRFGKMNRMLGEHLDNSQRGDQTFRRACSAAG